MSMEPQGRQHLDDVLHRDRVVIGMPAVEVGHHGDGGISASPASFAFGILVMPITE